MSSHKQALVVAQRVTEIVGDDNIDSYIEVIPSCVEIRLDPYCFYYGDMFKTHAEIIEQLTKDWEPREERYTRTLHRAKTKRHPASDWVRASGHIGGILVKVSYLQPHVHGDYFGKITDKGPRWYCRSCRAALSITESRKLGLLPKLDRSKK